MAVLKKDVIMIWGQMDAYVNIAGGMKMNEPAMDLAIVMALISSYKDRPLDEKTAVFGEVGLSVRPLVSDGRAAGERGGKAGL